MSNGDKTVKNKNILKLARQLKTSGRLGTGDLRAAEAALLKMSPGEKKARFGEMDDYQNMVAKKLEAGMKEMIGGIGKRMMRMPDLGLGPQPSRNKLGTKPVLDTQGKPVKNLRQAAKQGGQFQEVDVVDLTTEMVIDE